jgi:hypothetical protein
MFSSYLRRRSKVDPRRLVPGFLVGAHAKLAPADLRRAARLARKLDRRAFPPMARF